MGIGGIGHDLDAAQVHVHVGVVGGILNLLLAGAYRGFAAEAIYIELHVGHALRRQIWQQLHAAPARLHLHIRAALRECAHGPLQVAFADQAPGTDEVESHFDQQRFHLRSSLAISGASFWMSLW
ncbi:hypothetical protein D3C84_1039480 [compost metagenome]